MIIGTLTIGQSPRSDILPELTVLFPPGTRFVHAGALDGLTPSELSSYSRDRETRFS